MLNGRCYRHGGATPSGVASPHFKHGLYSKDLPTNLLSRYQEARQDLQLLELRDEIAVMRARIQDTLDRAGAGDSRRLVEELGKVWKNLEKARRKEDTAAEERALDRLEELVTTHHEDPRAWREVSRLIDELRRLVESERKRRIEARQMISAEEAMVLVSALLDAVKRHIRDPTVLEAIYTDIKRLVYAEASLERLDLDS